MEHTLPEAVFTAQDRCDRCGARAAFRALMDAGDLLFCNHHGRMHLDVLDREALYVEVQRPPE
jgi:hypothetical protein